ncbi:MAG: hypothetical protein OXG62_11850 [Nitrospinae bacterium]|nr:hypothetical protein [Nitrospinota bacterium]
MTTYELISIIAAFLNVIATYGYLALIYHGIRTMEQTYEELYGDCERKHDETMADIRRRSRVRTQTR